MRFLKSSRFQQAAMTVAIYVGFDVLRRIDPTRLTLHLAGSGLIVALMLLIQRRVARYLQWVALALLLADIVFRNPILAPRVTTDASPWRIVLAMSYLTTLAALAIYDHRVAREQLQLVHRDPQH